MISGFIVAESAAFALFSKNSGTSFLEQLVLGGTDVNYRS